MAPRPVKPCSSSWWTSCPATSTTKAPSAGLGRPAELLRHQSGSKTLVPSDNAPDKQNDSCRGCPMNSSAPPTGSGKARKNTRMLAVLPPDADSDTELWTLKVSPTGIKGSTASWPA